MESLREEADKAKRECLEVKKIADEKEILFKQEQAALRKVGPLIHSRPQDAELVHFNYD